MIESFNEKFYFAEKEGFIGNIQHNPHSSPQILRVKISPPSLCRSGASSQSQDYIPEFHPQQTHQNLFHLKKSKETHIVKFSKLPNSSTLLLIVAAFMPYILAGSGAASVQVLLGQLQISVVFILSQEPSNPPVTMRN